jgi:threonine-phosphate decarboxylase
MNYLHGGDIYRNPVEYDFSININPLGMPKGSIQAAKEGVLLSGQYPDYQAEALCQAIAQADGILPEQIVVGNGAAELIYGLCYALGAKKGLEAVPCFLEYEEALSAAGGTMEYWNLSEANGFLLDEDFSKAITEETDLVFLCNPNNPTGTLIPKPQLLRIAKTCEETGTWLCLDECFLPFLAEEAQYSLLPVIEAFPHLIILRAFTKIYGMPGLRLGYAVSANEALLRKLRSRLQPWNTSIPAQMAGIAALKDPDYLEKTRTLLAKEKEYLTRELNNGLVDQLYDSSANYLFFHSRTDLKERLLEKNILIRSCSNYRNLQEGFFRIGIRTREENEQLILRWREIF